jgi:hypothetical protein
MGIILANFATEMIARLDGPLHFRLFIQPIMAGIFAFRDGTIDVKKGRSPYGWTILNSPEHRQFLLKDGWKGISKVFILAMVFDLIYQWLALRSLNLVDSFIIGCLLAIIPYGLLRGLANRLIKRRK